MNTTQDLKDFYETTYPAINPHLDVADVEWKFEMIREYIDLLDSSTINNVVELGCGSGKLIAAVSSYVNSKGLGLDISHTILKKARVISSDVNLIQGKADRLPIKIDRFDMVYFADLLEHLEEPEEFLSYCSKAKSLIMFIPLEHGWIADLVYAYRRLIGKPTTREQYGHLHRWGRQDIQRMIRKSGLTLNDYKVVRGKVTKYQSLRGRIYGIMSQSIYSLSPSLHEKLFGGWTFIGICKS